MLFKENPEAVQKIEGYAPSIADKLQYLRQLIIDTADELELDRLDETLKWGEPSYKTKSGSTIRIDWKEATPDQYAMYFICTTGLVGNFQLIYGDVFKYEGNRAIIFGLDDKVPEKELKHCIELALTYHKVKNLPMLGV